MKEMTTAAVLESIPAVIDFVDRELERADCPMRVKIQIDIAIDELFSNIAHYAYGNEGGQVRVQIEMESDPRAVRITFQDEGMPFNPLEREDPDVTGSARERKIGGLGIFLVKKSMDAVLYEYRDGINCLTVRKTL